MNTLQLHDLQCRLGTRTVLRGLTAKPLERGQVVAVLGRNGAGKSTLLRCIAGFIPCQASRLQWAGTDLRPLGPAARADTVRYLPQAAPQVLHLTVQDCLLVALNARTRFSSKDARERIAVAASDLGIDGLMGRYLDELSGGQKQLVWLAQALVHRPQVLLLDEPLAALDPNYQHHVMKLLRRLAADQQLLVMVVLHDLNMAMRYADQAVLLRDGTVLAEGAVDRTLTPENLAHSFLIDARIDRCTQGTPLIIIDDLLEL